MLLAVVVVDMFVSRWLFPKALIGPLVRLQIY
jgi:hypothetical protein